MSSTLTELVPELREPALALAAAAGEARLNPRFTSTRRTRAQQTRLYRNFLAGLSPFPVAAPGTSAHEYGEAFDMIVSPYEALADVGYTWESWGGSWGGERDPVHFELPGASGRAKAQAGRVIYMEAADLRSYLNLALSFLPYVSIVTVAAWLASLVPGLSKSEALNLLQNPFDLSVLIASKLR